MFPRKTLIALALVGALLPTAHAATYQLRQTSPGMVASADNGQSQQAPAPSPCNLPWGGTLADNATYTGATVYSTSVVYTPTTCASKQVTLSCSNGQLSTSTPSLSCNQLDTDPYYSNVTYLLHMDGSSANQKGGAAPTDTGTVTYSSTNAKFGQNVAFAGSTNSFILLPSDALAFGTGDYTIEFWARGNAANTFIFDGQPGIRTSFRFNASGQLLYLVNNVTVGAFTNTGGGVWTHFAVSRAGSTTYLFTNGTLTATATDTSNFANASATNANRIGHYFTDTGYPQYTYTGQLDDFRITKGVARYTANFTVPTAAFPNQ